MEYLTVRETARKWNLSDRMVQQFCIAGRHSRCAEIRELGPIPATRKSPGPRSVRKQASPLPQAFWTVPA